LIAPDLRRYSGCRLATQLAGQRKIASAES
jgi:hypothetical protein